MLKDPGGIILITIGILLWIKPVVFGFIKLQNTLRGVQTSVTTATLWWYRICGLGAIIVGVMYILAVR